MGMYDPRSATPAYPLRVPMHDRRRLRFEECGMYREPWKKLVAEYLALGVIAAVVLAAFFYGVWRNL